MKKYLFLIMMIAAIMIGSTSKTIAQNVPVKKQRLTEEQIIEKRTNQMIQILMLDDATTAKFSPVYSQYLKEKMDCRKMTLTEKFKKDKKANIKTDADIDEMIQNQFAQSHKMLDIREKYYAKFHKILSSKQILKIYQTEKQDQKNLLKEMFKRRMRQRNRQNIK
jgi:hypothetical protein